MMRRRSVGVALLVAGILTMSGLGDPARAVDQGGFGPPGGAGSLAEDAAGSLAEDAAGGHPAAKNPAAKNPAKRLIGDIAFSVPSGTFRDSVTVSLNTKISRAQIRYTTNGDLPNSGSRLYSGVPLRLTDTTQLRAQPFQGKKAVGKPGTALYVANKVKAKHDLPVLVMDVYGVGKVASRFVDTAIMAFEPSGGVTALSAKPSIASRAGIHVRGQSSATNEKTAYRLEFRDNTGDDAKYPLFGLPADADWALRAPYFDKSLIRDAFGYSLGRDIGLRIPRFRFCELYLNLDGGALEADDYMGVYLLTETIKISKNRLNLAKIKKRDVAIPAIQGGYVFKFDYKVAQEPIIWCTGPESTCWKYLEVVAPAAPGPEQKEWLRRYVQQFHDMLRSKEFADPEKGYPAWIDVGSFVDYAIISEFSRNSDAYMRSAYFHKDRKGKLIAGPLWDFDLTWGTGGLRDNLNVEGWQYREQYRLQRSHDWYVRLFCDPGFVNQVAVRWRQLRAGPLSDSALAERVDWLAEPLSAGAQRNFRKWPILTTNHLARWVSTPTTPTWEGQVDLTLTWMRQRAAWLDTQWG